MQESTFACPAQLYINCRDLAGTKNESKQILYSIKKKAPEIDPHLSNPKSDFVFEELFFRTCSAISAAVPFPVVADASVSPSAAVGGSVVGVVGLL